MKKIQLIHSDTYSEINRVNNVNTLKDRWHHWKTEYDQYMQKTGSSPQIIADKAQAWHILCSITALLKEADAFDLKNRKPKE